jgi:hypothetical protein
LLIFITGNYVFFYASLMVRKSEGKKPLRRPRFRWEDNIRMEIREIGWGSVIWMHLD